MIPALETAGFFLVITAVLQFSSWAEGWLTRSARPVKDGAPSVARTIPERAVRTA